MLAKSIEPLLRPLLTSPGVKETDGGRGNGVPSVDAFRELYRAAIAELTPIVASFNRTQMETLGKHNWAWASSNFIEYMSESEVRYANAYALMRPFLRPESRVLDVGGFLAPFPLALRKAGFAVTVAERYDYYGGVLEAVVEHIRRQDMTILAADFRSGPVVTGGVFDIVLCMAVAEHLASSPEALMMNMRSALAASGRLLFEVPNQLAWVHRVQLMRGQNFMPSIETIWRSATPFTGHHHEYTEEDVKVLMRLAGFSIERMEFVDCYSTGDSVPSLLLYRLIPRLFPRTRDTVMALAVRT